MLNQLTPEKMERILACDSTQNGSDNNSIHMTNFNYMNHVERSLSDKLADRISMWQK